jgi:2-C-methyl-D-erythritol 2,4-cyclodiphosphate synthase
MKFKIGFGFDVHPLKDGHPFYLGGVLLEDAQKGAWGHSDADVLIHALCDAILGALALRDIGFHFPNTDPKYKGIRSTELLKHVVDLLKKEGYLFGNADCTIVLEAPKINPKVEAMQQTLSAIIGCEVSDVSIKATTNEKLGFVGREEGVTAYASVLVYKG